MIWKNEKCFTGKDEYKNLYFWYCIIAYCGDSNGTIYFSGNHDVYHWRNMGLSEQLKVLSMEMAVQRKGMVCTAVIESDSIQNINCQH